MSNITPTNFKLTPIKAPLVKPLRQSNGTINDLMLLHLTLETKEGVTGESFIYGIGRQGHHILIPYIEKELAPQILNKTFQYSSDIWQALWLPRRDKLKGGMCLYAHGLIDIALWDIASKQSNKSLHRFLGGTAESVPIYGSGGWLSMSLDELAEECQEFMQKRITLYKIKVGGKNDEERIKFLRQEFGDKIQLAVDANQLLGLNEAIELANMLKNYGIQWFEDPLFSDSIFDLKKLAYTTSVPICTGENFHSEWQFQDLCEIDAAQFLQPDVVRCGGITPFLKIISIAEKFNKKLITHLMPELSISLLPLCKNGYACEMINLFSEDFFTRPFKVMDGNMKISKEMGIGVYIQNAILNL